MYSQTQLIWLTPPIITDERAWLRGPCDSSRVDYHSLYGNAWAGHCDPSMDRMNLLHIHNMSSLRILTRVCDTVQFSAI